MSSGTTAGSYTTSENRRVEAPNGTRFAYRDLGSGEVPLVLLQHFRGNLDNWDPALIDDLAAGRRVVTFDNRGVGGTTGMTPNTIEAMAHDAIAFVEAMGLTEVDLLGYSIGSFVAQEIALVRPGLLRRIVLAWSARLVSRNRTRGDTLTSSSLPPARAGKQGSRSPGASSGGRPTGTCRRR